MNKKSKNPIAEQSRRWLMEALILLMAEKRYEEITVTEIADRALLSRRTFYRMFKSKEEMLEQYFQLLYEQYTECFDLETNLSYVHIVEVYFTFWEQHIDFLKILNKNHLLFILIEKYNDFLPVIYKEVRGEDADNAELEYTLRFSSGGLWNVLSKWLEHDPRESPQKMAAIILEAIRINNPLL